MIIFLQVELHIRYIQLQRLLQCKMNDLERLCIRERQLLEGKWKTHSLPARKKATASNGTDAATQSQISYSYCRPTVSTEDVAKVPQPTQTVMLAYQYLEPHYRTYILQPSASNSGEYLLPFESPRFKSAQHHFIVKTPCDSHKPTRSNDTSTSSSKSKSKNHQDGHQSHSYSVHLCPSCMRINSNMDNASLEAYDLASPCCDPHCVPTSRRRSRHKEHHRKDSKSDKDESHPRSRPHSQVQTKHNYPTKSKYFNFSHGLVSQCSLHSCTSSELSGIAQNAAGESSAASYTTSLSTDTLYWENPCELQGRRSSKSHPKIEYQQYPSTSYDGSIHYAKPKSWDNLTTKAYGGYGFGYGYVESSRHLVQRKDGRSHSTKSTPCGQYIRTTNEKHVQTQSVYVPPSHHIRYIHPTKSSENLLALPKFSGAEGTLSDSSLSCECLEAAAAEMSEVHFFPATPPATASGSIESAYGSRRLSKRHSSHDPSVVATTSEITRL